MHLRQNKRGMALLLVLASIVVITVMIVELNYNARMASSMSANYRDEIAAEYLAKSSVNVALLRLAIVRKIKTFQMGSFTIPPDVISMIISMPFIFDHSITGMDSKININMVALNEDSITTFKEQMKNLYAAKVTSDESFGHRYSMDDFEILLNNIIDWIDADNESMNGGDETKYYDRKDPPYKPRNASIPTLSELHMIEGMNDELFDFISPMLTVFSTGKINVNKISDDMWKTIDNRLTDDEIKAVRAKIDVEGPFTNEKELRTWIGQNTKIPSTEFNPLKISLAFDDENFKIEATGYSGKVLKKIVCYVSNSYSEMLSTGKASASSTTSTGSTTSTSSTTSTGSTTPVGSITQSVKPNVVYWEIR
ncbi:MAG: type II secretion system protein GspK [Proteobacteria bacterium]|nr:type II secretion system protein GspK [Pseudomonadota bacterium]